MTPPRLRRALPRAYYAFYGRHGALRKIQLDSAAHLLAGRDALLLAPAATGKTEAFSAPLFERLLAENWPPPAILLVSPTRALANDLARRLREPADALGVPLGRWTGERKEPDAGGLPAVTILTPESLDARLARSPGALRTARALVLDELHVLDGTPRGDQLRILVSRLRRIAPGIQIVAASATVADPEGMSRRYLVDAQIVRDPARLPIRAKIVSGRAPKVVARETAGLARAGARKFLLFANRRDLVETYAAALERFEPFRGLVYAHHGSLSKRSRESAEGAFLSAPRAVCVATMTLELGIDIGDVDVVGLLEPPADVAGLLQRIGRSGRRGRGPRALLFASDRADDFRYRTLLALAREGDFAADPPTFHPSVLVQQALSILHQNPGGWVSARAIRRRLDPELASEWTEERIERILARLAREGWLEAAAGGRYVEGPEAERRWRRGVLHSNLSDPRELEVFDSLTGEKIGGIAAPSSEARRPIQIAGRDHRVVFADESRVVVSGAPSAEPPRFAPRGTARVSLRLAQAHAR
ncbi:MAG: DEAD/DEAH box helicase, partial [Planctomycetota bacterium]